MRIDRWIRNTIGRIPQGLIEKSLRSGKIKVNKKKIKSSHKIKPNDKIDFYGFKFEERISQKKISFNTFSCKRHVGCVFTQNLHFGYFFMQKASFLLHFHTQNRHSG